MKKIVIAIDGHSSCGKSTMAKDLAKAIKYTYIDTGAMYRAVTYYALCHGMIREGKVNEEALVADLDKIKITFVKPLNALQAETFLNGVNVEKEIRELEVANYVSPVATIAAVRRSLVLKQQEMGKAKGIVMDGRDIGTVVFPQAELKIFLTASAEVRAQRRLAEMKAKEEDVTYEAVLENIEMRDQIDSTRKESPLRQAEDALVLDNSALTILQQKEWLLARYKEVINKS
ncbi:MAG: (d)CMP kinase [Massilibacteroides sp.]|nr:(d)CMP kinase [Massilibacteroides sp.]